MAYIRTLKKENFNNMDSINDGTSIYPITVAEAVIDKNNNSMAVIMEDVVSHFITIDDDVAVLKDKALSQEATINVNSATMNTMQVAMNNIQESINNTISKPPFFGGTVSSSATSENRGTSEAQNCIEPIYTSGSCTLGKLDDVLDNLQMYIVKSPGIYNLNNTEYTISEVSIILYHNELWKVMSLGIPFIPEITEDDAGKSLKASATGKLYWG